VKLNEGNNEINVDAYDSSGNTSRAELAVKRKIPFVMQNGCRMSVSILPFDIIQQKEQQARRAYERLIGEFVRQGRFRVIERTKLEKVLLEQKLVAENLTDPKYSIKVGRLMSADAILATSMDETDQSIEFTSRAINTETKEDLAVVDVFHEDKSLSSIRELMSGLATKIAYSLPLVEGLVIDKEKKYVHTDLGINAGIKTDMRVIVYRKGDEKKHPVTGRSLGRDAKVLAEGRIDEIYKELSKVNLFNFYQPNAVKIKDLIITK
jgi:hypothetical protein